MRSRTRVFVAILRDRNLLRIQLAYGGFSMSEYATWMAMLVYAYNRGGATAAGVVALIQLVPAGLAALFAAFSGDRFRRDRVLFLGYVIQAAGMAVTTAAISLGAAIGLVYAAAAFVATAITLTRPAQSSLLPNITETPEDLTAANVVSGTIENAGIFVGPFIAGVVLSYSGPAEVFAICTGVMIVAALLVARLKVDPASVTPLARMEAGDVLHETLGGFRALRYEPRARTLVLLLAAESVVVAGLEILFVAAAIDLLGMGQGGGGFLVSAAGLGGVVGAIGSVVLVGRRRLTPPLAVGATVMGAPIVVLGLASSALVAPVLAFISGSGRSVTEVSGRTLLQRTTPDEVLSRVFGVLEGIAMLALAGGSVLASALAAGLGIGWALVVIGAFVPVVVLVIWRAVSKIDREAEAPDFEWLALIRRIPIFAPLPAPAIERLMLHVAELEVPADTVLIREGETGDRFYVIVEGEAVVTRGLEHVVDRGPGDYMGEIALLRDVPRTASVTAKTPLRLLALDRDPFLEAVTGHPQTRELAESVVDERMAR